MLNSDYFIKFDVVEIYDHVVLGRKDANEIRKFMKNKPTSKAAPYICIKGLEIFETENTQRGVRTTKFIKAGNIVVTFCGVLKTHKPLDMTYVVEYKEGLWIDAKKFSNISRWINHKCGVGNLKLVKTSSLRFPTIYLVATRDIEPGEELNYNYGYKIPGCQCDVCLKRNPLEGYLYETDESDSDDGDSGEQSSSLLPNSPVSSPQSPGALESQPLQPDSHPVTSSEFTRPTFSPPRKSTRFQNIVTSALSSLASPQKAIPKTNTANVVQKHKKKVSFQLRKSPRLLQPSLPHPVLSEQEVAVPSGAEYDGPNYVVKHVKMSYYDYFKRTCKLSTPRTGAFACELCEFRTSEKSELSRHTKRIHGETTKVFVCIVDGCSKESPDVSRANLHARTVHNKTAREREPGKKFKCGQCEKTFAKKYGLERHYINSAKKNRLKRVCVA